MDFWITIFSAALMLAVPLHSDSRSVPVGFRDDPLRAAEAYLKAIQSRDFETAYGYISAADRSIRDKASYLRSQKTLSGFALELAKRLAADMEVWITDQKRSPRAIHFELGYRVAAGDEIYPDIFDWDVNKLNDLPEREQRRIVQVLQDLKNSGKMIMFQGHESLDLVHEKSGWRVFLGWPLRSRVVFKAMASRPDQLEIQFLRSDFLVANNEPFDIEFTVRNRTAHAIVATLNHRIEPRRLEKNLAMIACGALAPLCLRAGETQKISTSYILGDLSPKSYVSIIYQFGVQPEVSRTNNRPQSPGQTRKLS